MKLVNRSWKKILLFILCIIIASLGVAVWFKFNHALAPIIPPTSPAMTTSGQTTKKVVKQPTAAFDKTKYSNSDPSSIWIVVNKQHPLSPIQFIPNDLVTTNGATISAKARLDFDAMMADALSQGVHLTIVSSYRSYDTQNYLYNNYVATYGQASTDTFSARPGYSEHQTGLAIDFGGSTNTNCNLDNCYEATVEGKWLANHAYQYGFLLRYTAEKQPITGYKAEPWHFRYIGRELATEMRNKSIITLEEFFNIRGGETYS